ncbi:MAG TPA: hypothetical protein VEQ85_10390 [Lacipirellulaceae bacterium]|nr:hypothetical protein [Lacipirellulaceae bacterium]
MGGPLKVTRSWAPRLFVGGMCAAATAANTLAGAPQSTIPPCSPEGVCVPRYETWGWYETRWRPFPGDPLNAPPTPADTVSPAEQDQQRLGGPQLPSPGEEEQTGPERRPTRGPGAGAPAVGPGAAPASPTLPADEGAGGAVLPPADGAGVLPPADAPADAGAAPGELPAAPADAPAGGPADEGPSPDSLPDPLDPFGAAPAPPEWMVENAAYSLPVGVPVAAPTATPAAAQEVALPVDAPNMQGEDAPPALPAGLRELFGAAAAQPSPLAARGQARVAPAPMAGAPIALAQPARVAPTGGPVRGTVRSNVARGGVVMATAERPLGIQLVNPASAVAAEPGLDGLQQAIYFEASDLPPAGGVQLPPVAPGN